MVSQFVFLLVLVFSGWSLHAQQLTEEDLLSGPDALLNLDLTGTGNITYLQQVGADNKAEIVQQSIGAVNVNLVKVLQAGDYNQAFIFQKGSGNQTALIQKGDDNYYKLQVDGDDNKMSVIQEGNRNQITQDLINSNQLNIQIVQQGSDNEVIQILDGNNAQEFKVIQIGDGLKAIINQTPN